MQSLNNLVSKQNSYCTILDAWMSLFSCDPWKHYSFQITFACEMSLSIFPHFHEAQINHSLMFICKIDSAERSKTFTERHYVGFDNRKSLEFRMENHCVCHVVHVFPDIACYIVALDSMRFLSSFLKLDALRQESVCVCHTLC